MALNKIIIGGITLALIVAAIFLFPRLQGISEASIRSLPPSITVGEVVEKFGEYKLGHGIYVWYPHESNPNKTYWFFLEHHEKIDDPDAFDFNSVKIVFVALVPSPPEPEGRNAEVLWPNDQAGRPFMEVHKGVYGIK